MTFADRARAEAERKHPDAMGYDESHRLARVAGALWGAREVLAKLEASEHWQSVEEDRRKHRDSGCRCEYCRLIEEIRDDLR